MSTRLTDEQLAALKDAHRSINEGGLIEMPSQNPLDQCWTAMNPQFKKRHAHSTIKSLSNMQLLVITGLTDQRNASISELGLMHLDIEGAMQ